MPAKPDHLARGPSLIPLLQRSPRVRSTFYLGSMVVLLSAARALNDKLVSDPKSLWYQDMNTTVFPAALALSYVFARLRPEDLVAWHRAPTKSEIAQLGQGLAMGTTAMLAVFGTAAAKGWISSPTWGWEQVPMPVLLHTIAGLSAKYAIAAWEEEIVFRGYGFDALRQAIGPIGAAVVSAVLFARYHGPEDISTFLTLTLGGVMFTLLRLKHENLWLPFGFHLAWNLVQIVVFGPKNSFPSLRPIELHGPPEWIGTPGLPEPGILSILATAGVAILTAYQLWRAARSADRTHASTTREV